MTDRRRSWPCADELAGRNLKRKAFAKLAREQLRLIESALTQPRAVQRHLDRPWGRKALDHQALRQQQRKRFGQAPPAVVLESLKGDLDRALVCHCGAEGRKRLEAVAAAAVLTRGFDLRAASATQRFLEAPDSRPAVGAQP